MNKSFFNKLFKYNLWRHNEIYKAINKNPIYYENLSLNSGIYFNTVKGTFNHILLADLLWYMRLKNTDTLNVFGNVFNVDLLNFYWNDNSNFGNAFEKNNDEWFLMHQKRNVEINDNFIKFIEELEENKLSDFFSYKSTSGDEMKKTRNDCLFHVINHTTHHLGQIGSTLTLLSKKDYPSTDFTLFELEK